MPRITKDNPLTNYISRAEIQSWRDNHDRAVIAQENQKLARIQLVDALETVLEMFETNSTLPAGRTLQELDAAFPCGSVYGIVKAAVARIQEARL
jgi:hypothetical protein